VSPSPARRRRYDEPTLDVGLGIIDRGEPTHYGLHQPTGKHDPVVFPLTGRIGVLERSDWPRVGRRPRAASRSREFVARRQGRLDNFDVPVLHGVCHRDRLLNSPLDAPQIDGFRWGIAAVQEYPCDAMWLDACGND